MPCPKCLGVGHLTFTASRVARGIVHYDENGELTYEELSIPLARCHNCGARIRVLPQEILPRKVFSLSVIERCCRTYLQPSSTGPGLRTTVTKMGKGHPHYTTLYRWLEGLGERVLDRIHVRGVRSKGRTGAASHRSTDRRDRKKVFKRGTARVVSTHMYPFLQVS